MNITSTKFKWVEMLIKNIELVLCGQEGKFTINEVPYKTEINIYPEWEVAYKDRHILEKTCKLFAEYNDANAEFEYFSRDRWKTVQGSMTGCVDYMTISIFHKNQHSFKPPKNGLMEELNAGSRNR